MGAEDVVVVPTFSVADSTECDHIGSTDYYFHGIGASIPLTSPPPSSSSSAYFDLNSPFPPTQPLAVAERRGIVFAAHSSGFCVARTKDLVETAKEMTERNKKGDGGGGGGGGESVVGVSVVDVRVGRVTIVAVSCDEETVAVSVGNEILFFDVDSLLRNVLEPFFSCSVKSDFVRSICWSRKISNSFLVLDDSGKLYKGALREPLQEGLDDVDAVDWGVTGEVIAVARENIVSIFSATLKERSRISLPFGSWIADSNSSCCMRVDSIRWLRSDCIVIGCLEQTADENEENYLVHAIISPDGNFLNASSEPLVVQLSYLFLGIVDDIMPFRCGPHLLACYLEEWALAFFANRKNTTEHIALVGWSDANNGPAIIDIPRDDCLPRIDLQENQDENLVLGMCVHKASVYEKVGVNLAEGKKELLSPYCILLCLTLDGKLIMYHVSSVARSLHLPAVISLSDDEEESVATGPMHVVQQSGGDQKSDKVTKVGEIDGGQLLNKQDLSLSKVDGSLTPRTNAGQIHSGETVAKKGEDKLPFGKQSFDSSWKQLISSKETSESQRSGHLDNEELKKLNFKTIQAETTSHSTGDVSVIEKLRTIDSEPKTDQLRENYPSNLSGLMNASGKYMFEVSKKAPEKPVSATLQGDAAKSASSIFPALSGGYGMRSPFQSANVVSSTSASVGASTGAAPLTKGFLENSGSSTSSALIFSGQTKLNVEQKDSVNAGRMGTSSGSPKSQGIVALTKSRSDFSTPVVDQRNISLPSRLNELKSLKRNGNVKDMADDLDKLLQGIEEELKEFKHSSISDPNNSLESLEEGIKALFDGSKKWKGYVDQQLEDTLHLLDKTVQALVRKVYMEGIIKQTTDSQYWDIWERQRLSSELEVKRENILTMSENLINQLRDLEKHFNALELNRFGGTEVDAKCRRSLLRRSTASENIQSLRTVQNAMTSQLAAAEQLSECLSRQMAALNVKSPEAKREDLKKQLFETIGIPYNGENLDSPDKAEKIAKPSTGNTFLSPYSLRGDKSSRNQAAVSSHEPETLRRRRDSLGQSLVKFEPPKTTIKRMAVRNELLDVDSSFSSIEKQLLTPFKLEVASPKDQTLHSTVLDAPKTIPSTQQKVAPGSSSGAFFTWNKGVSEASRGGMMGTHSMQTKYDRNAVLTREATKKAVPKDPNLEKESHLPRAAMPSPEMPRVKQYEPTLSKEMRGDRSDTLASQVQPVSGRVPAQTSVTPWSSDVILLSKSETTTLMQPGGGNVDQRPSGDLSFFSVNSKSFAIPSISDQPGNFFKSPIPTTEAVSEAASSHALEKPVSPRPSSLVAEPSSASISSFSALKTKTILKSSTLEGTLTGKESSKTTDQSVSTMASSTVTPTNFGPSTASSMVTPASFLPPSALPVEHLHPSTTMISKLEFQKADIRPPAEKVDGDTPTTKVDLTPEVTSESPNALPESGSASTLSPTPAATNVSNMASNSEGQKPSFTFLFPKEHLPSPSGGSTVTATADEEDEMEEEASESSQTIDLNMGSLTGLGPGTSNPTISDSKPNPFGVSFPSRANVPSSFSMSPPSNDLFRPASFSFQSLQPSPQTQPPPAFNASNPPQAPASGGFGQPSQIGGQHALGSVLGSFGQSRQLGSPLPGTGFSGGFPAPQSASGFANAAAVSGFAAVATSGSSPAANAGGGGFAALATAAGGFAAMATGGGGFGGVAGGGGFASAAGSGGFSGQANGGGGFGAFSNQGAGGFGGSRPAASSLFTQMRK